MQETQEVKVQSLGWEGSLEKEVTASYSCLEDSVDRRGWRAPVHGVTELDMTE